MKVFVAGGSGAIGVPLIRELVAAGHRVGYLLKSRVTDVTEFIDTVERIEVRRA